MSLPHAVVGIWRLPSAFLEGAEEFIHIGEDGRIVHFVYPHPSASKMVPASLRAERLEQDRYRIRIHPQGEGWTVRLIPTTEGMTVDRSEKQFHLAAVPDAEVPDWFGERLEKALARMLERAAGPPPSSSP